MALFFDRIWFDAILKDAGLNRDDLALRSGIGRADLDLMVKDQMEISPHLIQLWAHILNLEARELAARCGVTNYLVLAVSDKERIEFLEARVFALEAQIAKLLTPPTAS